MFTLDVNEFRKVISTLERVRFALSKDLINEQDKPVGSEIKPRIRKHLAAMQEQATVLQCIVTSKTVERCIAALDGDDFTGKDVLKHFDHIGLNLEDELGVTTVVVLESKFAQYHATTAPLFGDTVFKLFPSISDEISASGRCLAFGCGTAAAFHLMRVMEVGLRAVGRSLGITDGKNWGDYLSRLNARISQNKAKRPRGWTNDEPFFEDIIGDLTAVKTAWRNPTIHTVKPFDQNQAEILFVAVRSFMQRLATRFDENGKRPARAKTK